MKAWHFLPKDRKLRWGSKEKVKLNEWYHHKGELKLCQSGFHASKSILDALRYSPGPIICRVEVGGKIIHDTDKVVAEKRRVLWWIDGDDLLWRYARRCALDVIHLWDAPEAVVKYLKTGDESLRDAARAAAWDAARDAARAARDAAMAAVRKKQERRLLRMIYEEKKKQSKKALEGK